MAKKKVKDINQTEIVTEDKIDKRTLELIKILDQKDANNRAEFERKEKALRKQFGETIVKLIRKVKH